MQIIIAKAVLVLLFLSTLTKLYAQNEDSAYVVNRVESSINILKKELHIDKRVEIFEIETGWAEGKAILFGVTTLPFAIQKLTTLLHSLGNKVSQQITLLPMANLGDSIYGVATLSVCNMRTKPAHAAEMATQIILGTPVQILQKKGLWLRVRTPEGYIAWTEAVGIGRMNAQEYKQWQQTERIIYTGDFGYAYQQPSNNSYVVSDLIVGNILCVIGKKKKYYHVLYPDKRQAYIPIKDAMNLDKWLQKKESVTASDVVASAYRMLGAAYLWGGTSTRGIDCSGFVKTAYFLNGIVLTRDASQQVFTGEPVTIKENGIVNMSTCLKNLKPADLLFFKEAGDTLAGPAITHVAIYIDTGNYIHAAGMVGVNELLPNTKGYLAERTNNLIAAKRMLTQIGSRGIVKVKEHPFYFKSKKKI